MVSELDECASITFKLPKTPKLRPTALPNITSVPRLLLPPSVVQDNEETEFTSVKMYRTEVLSREDVSDMS